MPSAGVTTHFDGDLKCIVSESPTAAYVMDNPSTVLNIPPIFKVFHLNTPYSGQSTKTNTSTKTLLIKQSIRNPRCAPVNEKNITLSINLILPARSAQHNSTQRLPENL